MPSEGAARLCDISGIRLPADVLHIRQMSAQMGWTTANIQYAVARLRPHVELGEVPPYPIRAHEPLQRFVDSGMG
jgi:hypothetical protein